MPWTKGQSGNPGGRKPGAAALSRYISQPTGDGQELVDRLLVLVRESTTPKDVKDSVMILLDRLHGKPVATEVQLRISDSPGLPPGFASWPAAERSEYLHDLRRNVLQSGEDGVLDVIDEGGNDDGT